ncbi:MAG: hypothetical protein KGH93_02990 [Patescibacteria group bacterium]|nr:hypothetical protein [Patescibacteria group bacterium]MDE1946136.1 hypothetical protein [Patescibacteria group bacterium]
MSEAVGRGKDVQIAICFKVFCFVRNHTIGSCKPLPAHYHIMHGDKLVSRSVNASPGSEVECQERSLQQAIEMSRNWEGEQEPDGIECFGGALRKGGEIISFASQADGKDFDNTVVLLTGLMLGYIDIDMLVCLAKQNQNELVRALFAKLSGTHG